jgi:aspartate kinase
VHRNDYAKAMKLLKGQVQPHIKCREVSGDERIAAQMFRTLAEEGINIQMISTSEIKITVVIEEKYTELAVRVLQGFRTRPGVEFFSFGEMPEWPKGAPC